MMALLDVIIVGAGPAGVTAAIYAKRKGLSVEIISDSVGGQVSKTGQIENYPGYEQISGLQLTKELKGQIDRLHINVNVSRASKVEHVDRPFSYHYWKVAIHSSPGRSSSRLAPTGRR